MLKKSVNNDDFIYFINYIIKSDFKNKIKYFHKTILKKHNIQDKYLTLAMHKTIFQYNYDNKNKSMKNIQNFLFLLTLLLCNMSILVNAQENKPIQKPFAIIEGIEAGKVELTSLLAVDSIICSDKSFRITSFSMSLKWESGDIVEVLSKSNRITNEMKEYLNKEGFSKKIWIENIEAVKDDGTIIKLSPITLTIR